MFFFKKTWKVFFENIYIRPLGDIFNRRDAKYAELPQRNILLSPRILSDLCASAVI